MGSFYSEKIAILMKKSYLCGENGGLHPAPA